MTFILRLLSVLGPALVLCGTAAASNADRIFGNGFEPRLGALASGGSNYLWFGDNGQCVGNSRDAYGLLKRYHETDPVLGPVRTIAQGQLADMRQKGMRRLSLGIYFMHQPASNGTLIDSGNPQQVAQAADNLGMLLADVKQAGFSEVLFRFFATDNMNPSQPAFPTHGTSAYNAHIDEYWNLIETLRPVLVNSNIDYRIDLLVEGAPRDSNNTAVPVNDRYKYPANTTWSRAVRELWQRYHAAYGASDTIGFSFLVDEDSNRIRSRVRHMRYVYEGSYPHVFGLDFYAGDVMDEYQKFVLMDTHMKEQNPSGAHWDSTGWIIAEAYYEDPLSADALAAAIWDTDRTVFYLTQWPLDRASQCMSEHVNVAPPYDWLVWPMLGF